MNALREMVISLLLSQAYVKNASILAWLSFVKKRFILILADSRLSLR